MEYFSFLFEVAWLGVSPLTFDLFALEPWFVVCFSRCCVVFLNFCFLRFVLFSSFLFFSFLLFFFSSAAAAPCAIVSLLLPLLLSAVAVAAVGSKQ